MKKFLLPFLAFIVLVFLISCQGASNDQEGSEDVQETSQTEVVNEPEEPSEEHKCAFCNMKVHEKTDPMGVFTAQAITDDGEHLFFDDSGCLLNVTRKGDITMEEEWVRDFHTSEWIKKEEAVVVKADITTPMKYGYAFFKDQESADKFIADHANENAVLSSWEEIDQVSNERYMKKMQNHNN